MYKINKLHKEIFFMFFAFAGIIICINGREYKYLCVSLIHTQYTKEKELWKVGQIICFFKYSTICIKQKSAQTIIKAYF